MAEQTCPICGLARCNTDGHQCCWSCNAVEPIPPNVYRICRECGHVWTKRSLRVAYRRELTALSRNAFPEPFKEAASKARTVRYFLRAITTPAPRIDFCQECIHDW